VDDGGRRRAGREGRPLSTSACIGPPGTCRMPSRRSLIRWSCRSSSSCARTATRWSGGGSPHGRARGRPGPARRPGDAAAGAAGRRASSPSGSRGADRYARRGGPAARSARALRSHGLHGRATHRRDRFAHGARRATFRRPAPGRRTRFGLVAAGLLLGISGAWALTRLLSSALYEVSPSDPATFGGVAVVLAASALVACWLPARRATRIDPMPRFAASETVIAARTHAT